MQRSAGRISRPLLQGRATAIGGDRENPWFERALRVPPLEAPKSPEEDVLGDVFRVFTLSQHPETKGEDKGLEPLDQFARGGLLAAETPLDQGCFVGHSTPCASISKYLGRPPRGFSNSGPTAKHARLAGSGSQGVRPLSAELATVRSSLPASCRRARSRGRIAGPPDTRGAAYKRAPRSDPH